MPRSFLFICVYVLTGFFEVGASEFSQRGLALVSDAVYDLHGVGN